jgi:hypothetical protein
MSASFASVTDRLAEVGTELKAAKRAKVRAGTLAHVNKAEELTASVRVDLINLTKLLDAPGSSITSTTRYFGSNSTAAHRQEDVIRQHLVSSVAFAANEEAKSDLYERDFAEWSAKQAELLRQHAVDALDWEHLAEEIEDLAKREQREVRSRLEGLCLHLLKWAYQPEHRSGSWRGSIKEQRARLQDVLEDSPSLQPFAESMLARSYDRGRDRAADETGIPIIILPGICPWTLAQVIASEFWPER